VKKNGRAGWGPKREAGPGDTEEEKEKDEEKGDPKYFKVL
jgi:hypothetical protein